MSTNVDIDELNTHMRNAFTLSELLHSYRPDCEPWTVFGDIIGNVGFMLMEELYACKRAIDGEESGEESS